MSKNIDGFKYVIPWIDDSATLHCEDGQNLERMFPICYKEGTAIIYETYITSELGTYRCRFTFNKELPINVVKGLSSIIESLMYMLYKKNETLYLYSKSYSAFFKRLLKDINWELYMLYDINKKVLSCRNSSDEVPVIDINLNILEKFVTLDYFLGYFRLYGCRQDV